MVFWLVWFIIGMAFIVLYAVLLLPRLLLKARSAGFPVCGRAIRREKGGGTETVYYEPSAAARKYIKSYKVCRDSRGLFFKGEWAQNVAFAKYELDIYNAHNDLVEVITVKEKFNSGVSTVEVPLPKKTDLVSLKMIYVDDTPVKNERLPINAQYAIWSAAICVSMAAIVDVLLWMVITFVLGCVDGFTPTLSLPIGSWAALMGAVTPVAIAVTALFTVARHLLLSDGRRKE